MSHDDRSKDVLVDVVHGWSKSNWLTHPLFKSLLHQPNPVQMEALIGTDPHTHPDTLWVIRALFARIDAPGVRPSLRRLLRQGRLPSEKMVLWPQEKLRSRFLRDEIVRPKGADDILPFLALRMAWVWEEDAAQLGMGEAHPVAKLIRFEREDVLAPLFRSIQPQSWLDWTDPAADRMVSLILRKASVPTLAHLLRYDPRIMAWRQKKNGSTLLHKACAKLRPEVVSLLLGEGMCAKDRAANGMTPAHVALASVIEKTNPRQKASSKTSEMMDRLQEILHMLGSAGGLEGEADALMEELSSERMARMRVVVERALLCSVSSDASGLASSRRL